MYIPQGFNHLYGIPLIMEVGSLNTKIGFAGKERPDLIAPSVSWRLFSMSKSINPLAKRFKWISITRSQRKTAIPKVFCRIASLTIGKDFKHWLDPPWPKNYWLIPHSTHSSILSLHWAARSTVKNSLSSSLRNTSLMAYLCTKRQSYQLICLDWRVH